jgi:NAD(P)-dependent dehydrogenase (short-subunit alcohol dehydrogenase family)
MTKEAVHGSYLEQMKAEHGYKPLPKDRRALVVGSNRFDGADYPNIGAAIADRFDDDGFEVYDPALRDLDVRYEGQVAKFLREHPYTDTLVLCNGYTYMDWIEEYPATEMRRVLDCSLLGSMVATSEFVQDTINDPHHKHIVYIGSMAAKGVLNASAPYCAAKAGLQHFAKCMGWELTPKGYSVFVVNPSNTEGTPMTERTILHIMRYRGIDRAAAEAYWASINLKTEWLLPPNIAATVRYLVSGAAAYQSGTAIDLSGGQR